MLYFAYGSNLDVTQMQRRCPTARRDAPATLRGHSLVFAGFSRTWQGPVATVVRARAGVVQGLLYELDADALARLDRFEGVPVVYDRALCSVVDEHGRRRRAQVYRLVGDVAPSSPSAAYLAAIARAYDELGFDADTLAAAALARQPSK